MLRIAVNKGPGALSLLVLTSLRPLGYDWQADAAGRDDAILLPGKLIGDA